MDIKGIQSVSTIKDIRMNNSVKNKESDIAVHRPTARTAFGLPEGITIDAAVNYFPNMEQLSPETLFDVQYAGATKLSDGSVLVRPVILSLGEVDIVPSKTESGSYVVTRYPISGSPEGLQKPIIMTEKELIRNKSLCKGKLKQLNDNTFALVYRDVNGVKQSMQGSKKACLKVLRDNMLYM